ncbi:MAG: SDR family oxidoreductase [Omnitrophica bacterium]|nr:SDR family oxidoreductase [Candidatus Omnitrophota bacterium]
MRSASKVAIITGITKGIGKVIALSFAKEGMNLVGIARNKDDVDRVLDEIRQEFKIDTLGLGVDVSKSQEVDNILPKTLERFNSIDILVNNAAVGKLDYIIDSKLEDWQNIIDVNLKGVYLCSKTVLGQMIKQKGGRIINIASICGLKGVPRYGIYCVSKFGVVGFTEVMAQEAKEHNVIVSAVCPGIVDTGFADNSNYALTSPGNMLKPEAVAKLVLHLTKSSQASQICEIYLKPKNRIERLLKIKQRKTVIKRIKYLC